MCISGVADQLQTNYPSDLRKILKWVFLVNQTPIEEDEENEKSDFKPNDDFISHSTDPFSNDDHSSGNGNKY